MTSAELLSTMEELCLKQSWLSSQPGMSVGLLNSAFFSGRKNPVQPAVEKIVLDVRRDMEALVRSWIDAFESKFLGKKLPKSCVLFRYYSDSDFQELRPEIHVPESVYGVAIRRYADYLRGRGVVVTLKMVNRDEYLKWLGERENSVEAQTEWANKEERPLLETEPIRAACLDWSRPKRWRAPSGKEVRSLVLMGRMTVAEYAEVLGLKLSNAYARMQRWTSGTVPIPLEFWKLLCEHVGKENILVVEVGDGSDRN